MPRLDIDLVANVARLQQDMNKAVGLVDRGFRDMKRAGDQVRNILGVFGAGFGAYQFTRFIKDQIDAADAMHDLKLRTGFAVETLAGLDLVAKKTGTSLEALVTANSRLSKYATDAQLGLKENQKTLAALGITARDPTERLFQMADAIKAIEDPSLREAIALKTMGKSAGEIIPAFVQGGDVLRQMVRHGQELSGITDENAAAADKFNDELVDMRANASAAGLAIGVELVPWLSKLAKEFNYVIRVSDGFGASLQNAFFLNFNPQLFGITNDLSALQKKLEQGILTPSARKAVRAQIEFLKTQLAGSREALAQQRKDLDAIFKEDTAAIFGKVSGITPQFNAGNSTAPQIDINIQRIICQQMGGLWDGSVCNIEAGKFVDRLNKQIAGIYGDVFAALREQARSGGFLELVQADIRRAEAAQDAANATKYKNEQADIAIKADIANKQVTDEFIKSLRLSNEETRFQTSLMGVSTAEQEKLTAARRIDLDLRERVNRLDQDAPSYANDKAQLEASAEAARHASRDALEAQREVSRSFTTGAREGFQQVIEDATNAAAQIKGVIVDTFEGMTDTIVQFVMTGKANFRDFANSVLSDLLRIAIQRQITAPLAMAIFGGGLASGGPVSAGVSYLVGERGPEMFVPDTAGNIVPNGMGPNVSVQVINQAAPVDAEVSQPRFDGEKWVIGVLLKNIDNNGPLRGAIAGLR